MPISKLWDAQDALYALVSDAVTLHPREGQVTLGNPIGDLLPENVWVSGQVDDWTTDYRVSGLGAKDETFTLRVSIAVIRLGTEYLTARDRVNEIAQTIEQALHANPTLSNTVMLAKISSFRLEDTLVDERRRGVGLNIYVTCQAWLNS